MVDIINIVIVLVINVSNNLGYNKGLCIVVFIVYIKVGNYVVDLFFEKRVYIYRCMCMYVEFRIVFCWCY